MNKTSIGTKKEKRKNAEVSITGIISKDQVAGAVDTTLAHIQKEMELPGFRKGKVPMERVRQEIGQKSLWKEAAESVLREHVEEILKEHEILPIMPIGASLAPSDIDADVPFEIVAIVAPSCNTSGYQETAAQALKRVPAVDEEKEKGLAVQALRAQARQMVQSTGEGDLTEDEAHKLGLENAKAAEFFIQGEAARAVAERMLQKKRGAIADALIEKGSCDIPHVIIHEEAAALLEATKKDVTRHSLQWNEYLKQTGKTEESILKELESPAEKRVSLDLIFSEIARAEKLVPDEAEEKRLADVLVAQGIDHESASRYVRAMVLREKVWEILGAPSLERSLADEHGEKTSATV